MRECNTVDVFLLALDNNAVEKNLLQGGDT